MGRDLIDDNYLFLERQLRFSGAALFSRQDAIGPHGGRRNLRKLTGSRCLPSLRGFTLPTGQATYFFGFAAPEFSPVFSSSVRSFASARRKLPTFNSKITLW